MGAAVTPRQWAGFTGAFRAFLRSPRAVARRGVHAARNGCTPASPAHPARFAMRACLASSFVFCPVHVLLPSKFMAFWLVRSPLQFLRKAVRLRDSGKLGEKRPQTRQQEPRSTRSLNPRHCRFTPSAKWSFIYVFLGTYVTLLKPSHLSLGYFRRREILLPLLLLFAVEIAAYNDVAISHPEELIKHAETKLGVVSTF